MKTTQGCSRLCVALVSNSLTNEHRFKTFDNRFKLIMILQAFIKTYTNSSIPVFLFTKFLYDRLKNVQDSFKILENRFRLSRNSLELFQTWSWLFKTPWNLFKIFQNSSKTHKNSLKTLLDLFKTRYNSSNLLQLSDRIHNWSGFLEILIHLFGIR